MTTGAIERPGRAPGLCVMAVLLLAVAGSDGVRGGRRRSRRRQTDDERRKGLRLLLSFWEAIGYEQALTSCEESGVSTTGTDIRCAFDIHAIRSDEIGLGPYTGSSFDVTVHDGQVVAISQAFELGQFSPQMWEPFASWVSSKHPNDFVAMYTGSGSDSLLSEESIRLWERRSREYVEKVAG